MKLTLSVLLAIIKVRIQRTWACTYRTVSVLDPFMLKVRSRYVGCVIYSRDGTGTFHSGCFHSINIYFMWDKIGMSKTKIYLKMLMINIFEETKKSIRGSFFCNFYVSNVPPVGNYIILPILNLFRHSLHIYYTIILER